MGHRENASGDTREASSQAMVVEAVAAPVGRRDIAALVGALAGLAATGCLNDAEGSESIENLGSIAQAATGTSLRWVDTVLGVAPNVPPPLPPAPAAPPNPARPGDLATKNSANIGSAVVVIAKGCVTPGDGGGGLFYWDGGSAERDNGGTVIVPTVGGGCWRRIFSGDVNVKWFGAIGKVLSAATNDAPAIQAALNACIATGGVVFVPSGTYQIKTTLKVPSNVTLSGAGMGLTTIYMPAASFTNTTPTLHDATSMAIDASGQLVSLPYTPAYNITLRDFTVRSEVSDGRCLYGIRASNVINLEIANIEVTGIPTGTLIELNSIRGSCSVHHCYLHDCGTAVISYGMQPQTTGIEIDNNKAFAELSRGIDVHDNHIIDIAFSGPALGTYGGQTDGVNLQDGTGILVHDNYMRNVGEGVDLFASDCSIHSNVLVDCYHAGVKLIHGASRNNVHHNVIVRPGRSGISLSGSNTGPSGNNYVNDNNIHDVNSSGIWSAISNAGLHTIAGGIDSSDSNTFARNRITGGSQMMYAIRNEAGTANRFIDNEAERWGGVALPQEDPPAYSSVKGGSATIINAKKTLVRVCAGSDQTINPGAGQVIVKYTTEQMNTLGEYDPATSVFTATSHRRIRVYATVRFSGVGSGEKYQLRIRRNSMEQVNNIQIAPIAAEFMFDVSDTLEVAPRDTVDVTLQHDSTSSRIISGNSLLSYLRIEEVAG